MEAALAEIVGLALDTVVDAGAGAALAAALARATGAQSFHLQVHAPRGMRMIAVHNTDDIIKEGYAAHYWRVDEWAARFPKDARRILESETYISDAEFKESEIYNDLLRDNGDLVGCAGGVFPIGDGESLVVGAHRTRNRPSFTPETIRRLNGCLPLLEHVVRARRRADAGSGRLAERVLNADVDPALVLDARCRLRFASRPARDALAEGAPLARTGAKVGAAGADAQPFAKAVEWACTGRGGSLVLLRGRDGKPRPVAIDPLPGEPGLAAVRWRDEEARLAQDVAAARAALGLTAAEARVAESLLRGLTPARHAQVRGVSITTVRSQLRALFGKAGVTRQAELVAILRAGEARPPR